MNTTISDWYASNTTELSLEIAAACERVIFNGDDPITTDCTDHDCRRDRLLYRRLLGMAMSTTAQRIAEGMGQEFIYSGAPMFRKPDHAQD